MTRRLLFSGRMNTPGRGLIRPVRKLKEALRAGVPSAAGADALSPVMVVMVQPRWISRSRSLLVSPMTKRPVASMATEWGSASWASMAGQPLPEKPWCRHRPR